MGYTIIIGDAVFDLGERRDLVSVVTLPNAPPDGHGSTSNERWPTYNGWTDFIDDCGLYSLFFEYGTGLMEHHPGCTVFERKHYEVVKAAFDAQCAQQTIKAYDMERLTWLEFWMRWALENCARPAVWNC